jgi:hypothetical protein
MGAETYLNATSAGYRIIARIPGRFTAKNLTGIRLVPDCALLHLFDKDTQASIIFPPPPRRSRTKTKIFPKKGPPQLPPEAAPFVCFRSGQFLLPLLLYSVGDTP